MNISKLAQAFDIHPGVLEAALDGTGRLLKVSRENVRPADKKALRGVVKSLEEAIDRVSPEAVRERLLEAVYQEPEGPDEDGEKRYRAWWEARDFVEGAIKGAQDLLTAVRAAEELNLQSGRPPYDHWTVAIGSLVEFWIDDLGRELTISGHASDPRGVTASPAVRFVHQCMQSLGENITEQACRTILQNLRDQKAACSGKIR